MRVSHFRVLELRSSMVVVFSVMSDRAANFLSNLDKALQGLLGNRSRLHSNVSESMQSERQQLHRRPEFRKRS